MTRRAIKVAIILSWCLLGACLIFKLCGSRVFEIAVHDENFIKVCNWLDGDGIIFSYVLSFFMSCGSNTFILMASALIYRPTWKQLLLIEAVNIPVWIVKFFFPYVGLGVECAMFIIVPAIISRKWWSGFLGYALNLIFQVCSLFIKGQNIDIVADNTIVSLVFSIDYYVMIALYYLYIVMIKKFKRR